MQTKWAVLLCLLREVTALLLNSLPLLPSSSHLLLLTLSLSSLSVCVSFIDGSSELLSSLKQLACRRSAHISLVSTPVFPLGNLS